MGIARSGVEASVAQQDLNGSDVGAGFQKMSGEAVAKGVNGNPLRELCFPCRLPAGALDGAGAGGLLGLLGSEEQSGSRGSRSLTLPVSPEDGQQLRGEHHVAILLSLALTDMDEHALAIDVAGRQPDDFGNAKAGRVGGHQKGLVPGVLESSEESSNFSRTQDDWKSSFPSRIGDGLQRPLLVQRNLVEKSKSGHGLDEQTARELLFHEVDLEGAHLFGPKKLGRSSKVSREPGDQTDVGLLGPR